MKIGVCGGIDRAEAIKRHCRNYITLQHASELIIDYKQENSIDHYYLRVELTDGRFGWTSPVWVEEK